MKIKKKLFRLTFLDIVILWNILCFGISWELYINGAVLSPPLTEPFSLTEVAF
ncbi:hypothetical protein [Marinifilum fragile]|uniref:hypothetical protein n=1 Tax=Marinifilum fragile TaxID=570161 RepID=UPI002AA71054|nr:hypothetical protein [Marinifilum fragile]